MSDSHLSVKKIKRHLEDHPGYYVNEEELSYLINLLDERSAALEKEQEAHRKTAKQFVDMESYARFLEKKYNHEEEV